MTLLQDIIFLAVGMILLTLLIMLGTYLQDNLVFIKYETRFTPHGLIIKGLDVLIIMFAITIALTIFFKFNYLYSSTFVISMNPIVGATDTARVIATANTIQDIFHVLTMILFALWIIMMFIFTKTEDLVNFIDRLVRGDK